jgi:hypothetical protein
MIYLGRITAEVGTAALDHQYWEIVSGKDSVSKTSWALLIDEMMQTDKWANYSSRYRADLEEVFEYLIEKIGKADVARRNRSVVTAVIGSLCG